MQSGADHVSDEQRSVDELERDQQQQIKPPDLNQDSDRSATRLELFFDLAFVLLVTRCADLLAAGGWAGVGSFVAMLTVGWWAWASTTLYANRFDTDDAVFRLLTLLGMAGVVGMAAAVSDPGGASGRWFALSYALLRICLVVGYLRARRHVPHAAPSIAPYLGGHAFGAVLWLISAAVPAPARYVLWAVGLLGDLLAPAIAARRKGVPMHMEHLPERFGLFIILVLGESVAAVITGLHDGHWSPKIVLAAVLAFTVAAALWWLYFDFSGGAAKRRLLEEGDDSRGGIHDVYVYAHLPIAVGLAALAVGLEQAVVHAGDPALTASARWTLAGGLALYLASTALLQAWMAGRLRASLPWPLAGVPVVLLLAALVETAPVLLASLALVLVVGLRSALAQNRAGWVRTAPV